MKKKFMKKTDNPQMTKKPINPQESSQPEFGSNNRKTSTLFDVALKVYEIFGQKKSRP
ncbi:MAG TPA: hypothetical protein VKO67_12400 [Smithellaceae bacterium]|nr:hypothetical protein [Smithellaceae bacterium]